MCILTNVSITSNPLIHCPGRMHWSPYYNKVVCFQSLTKAHLLAFFHPWALTGWIASLYEKTNMHNSSMCVSDEGASVQEATMRATDKLISHHLHFQNSLFCPWTHLKWNFYSNSSLKGTNTCWAISVYYTCNGKPKANNTVPAFLPEHKSLLSTRQT